MHPNIVYIYIARIYIYTHMIFCQGRFSSRLTAVGPTLLFEWWWMAKPDEKKINLRKGEIKNRQSVQNRQSVHVHMFFSQSNPVCISIYMYIYICTRWQTNPTTGGLINFRIPQPSCLGHSNDHELWLAILTCIVLKSRVILTTEGNCLNVFWWIWSDVSWRFTVGAG